MLRSALVSEVAIKREDSGRSSESDGGVTRRSDLIWRRISRFFLIYAVGWLLAIIYVGLIAAALNYTWPRDSINYTPTDRYADLLKSWAQAMVPNPYKNYGKALEGAYFPLAYAFLRLFRSFGPKTVVLIYLFSSFAAIGSVWFWWLRRQRALWKGDSRWPVFVCLSFMIAMCNYPLVFAVDRGNIDPFAVCLVFWGIELARRGQRLVGGLVIALAAAPKGFAFASVLYWVRRRYVLVVTAMVLTFAALLLVPATLFDGGIKESLRALSINLNGFRHVYILGSASAHYSSDWINAFRLLNRWLLHWQVDMALFVKTYETIVLVVSACLSFLAVAVIQETWRELLAIVLIMLIYPNVTNDYKLIVLLLPLLEWLASDARGWRAWIFCLSVALLFVPKHFYFPHVQDHASISCVINPVLITILLAAVWPTSTERSNLAYVTKRLIGRVMRRSSVWNESKAAA